MKTEITKDKLVELLITGYTNEQLAAYFNCGITTIKRAKTSFELVGLKNNSKPLSHKDIQQIQSLCEQGKDLQNIVLKTGITDYRIKKYVSDELYLRILVNTRKTFTINKIKADITPLFTACEESAYICGVLQSDGYLTSDGYIGLSSIDKDFVAHFAKFFSTSINTNGTTTVGNTIYTAKFKDIRYLEKFKQITNIYPQKTYSCYEIPTWIKSNSVYLKAFIVGVFNGDGSVYKPTDRDTCVISIDQHFTQEKFLKELNSILGWGEYLRNGKDFRIQTKTIHKVKDFYSWYSNSEFALLRKVSILDSVFL